MKDILLKTTERRKEILLSAGASAGVGGPLMIYSGHDQQKEVTGFDEGDDAAPPNHASSAFDANNKALDPSIRSANNPEDKDVDRTKALHQGKPGE